MNYQEFSVEDFVWDEHFRQWVLFPDAELNLFWTEWVSNNPDKAGEVRAARQVLTSLNIREGFLSDEDIDNVVGNVLSELEVADPSFENEHLDIQPRRSNFVSISIAVAASILIILSVAGYFFFDPVSPAGTHLVERVNRGSGLLRLQLGDGSSVTLEQGAKIRFPPSFTGLKSRKIHLSGEAFFDVAKDPTKPFIVYSNGLITKVLGTKFRIRSNASEKSSVVEVSSGIVAVYSMADKNSEDENNDRKLNSVLLTRNQKANYSNEDRSVISTVVERPVAINSKVFNYSFSETPIKQIFANMQEGYGIEIVYDEKLLAKRTFTADLSHSSMYDQLNIICRVLNTRYEIIDGKIIIYPN